MRATLSLILGIGTAFFTPQVRAESHILPEGTRSIEVVVYTNPDAPPESRERYIQVQYLGERSKGQSLRPVLSYWTARASVPNASVVLPENRSWVESTELPKSGLANVITISAGKGLSIGHRPGTKDSELGTAVTDGTVEIDQASSVRLISEARAVKYSVSVLFLSKAKPSESNAMFGPKSYGHASDSALERKVP